MYQSYMKENKLYYTMMVSMVVTMDGGCHDDHYDCSHDDHYGGHYIPPTNQPAKHYIYPLPRTPSKIHMYLIVSQYMRVRDA